MTKLKARYWCSRHQEFATGNAVILCLECWDDYVAGRIKISGNKR
jgi:hypothetical protein